MNFVAWKMLVGDRAKYIGIIVGLTFASLLITQQAAIFVGLMSRTYGAITDMGLPDIWVMDKKVQFIDDVKPLQDTQLYRVRGIDGVEWAVPLYKGLLKARLDNGNFQTCNVIGLDDATLIGGPPEMAEGKLEDLRRADSVIVDIVGAQDKLAHQETPTSRPIPLKIGDTLELNDHRATVVGLCRVGRTFQSQPVVYTTYSRATTFAPRERKLLSFVLVKAKPGVDPKELCKRIESITGLAAYTQRGFKDLTFWYFFKYTGIPINFGISVALGFIVGTAIAGQTFYNFTLDNLRHFGALKAMGASNGTLLRMIILQAITVGAIGYGLGVGLASLSGAASANSELAFLLPWQLLVITAGAVSLICVFSSLISIRKVIKLEPAIVFKS
ncbi:MAG TPA: ABC transporter permease [Tepidisphaeraceae bacterium]|jgi:putative ABC transport system permease protein|nr:ABC transporter permease [Tepidisphaeraceae bacterium]